MTQPTGLDLKVERIRARVTASKIAREMGVTRQRVSAIEALAVVPDEAAKRYAEALVSLTTDAQTPSEAA